MPIEGQVFLTEGHPDISGQELNEYGGSRGKIGGVAGWARPAGVRELRRMDLCRSVRARIIPTGNQKWRLRGIA